MGIIHDQPAPPAEIRALGFSIEVIEREPGETREQWKMIAIEAPFAEYLTPSQLRTLGRWLVSEGKRIGREYKSNGEPKRRAGKAPEGMRLMILPGHVTSANDGQRHFIGPSQLAHLYGVNYKDCEVYHRAGNQNLRATLSDLRLTMHHTIPVLLTPRENGDYSLEKAIERSRQAWESAQ
jgi:hypothetical protein